jgi:hypothetical protein
MVSFFDKIWRLIRGQERKPGAVLMEEILDHSGIAKLDLSRYSTLRYRFEPIWIHAHLVELRNQCNDTGYELTSFHE